MALASIPQLKGESSVFLLSAIISLSSSLRLDLDFLPLKSRFPCLDGVRFTFDPNQPPGNRVVPGSVYIRTRPLAQKRHSVIRGTNLRVPPAREGERENNGLGQFNKNSRGTIPPGYSPLDVKRKYSVGSTHYLISGKVRKTLLFFC